MTIDEDQVVLQTHVGATSAAATAAAKTTASAATKASTTAAAAAKASTTATAAETAEAAATAATETPTAPAETSYIAASVEASKFSGTMIRAGPSATRACTTWAGAELGAVHRTTAAAATLRKAIYVPLTDALARSSASPVASAIARLPIADAVPPGIGAIARANHLATVAAPEIELVFAAAVVGIVHAAPMVGPVLPAIAGPVRIVRTIGVDIPVAPIAAAAPPIAAASPIADAVADPESDPRREPIRRDESRRRKVIRRIIRIEPVAIDNGGLVIGDIDQVGIDRLDGDVVASTGLTSPKRSVAWSNPAFCSHALLTASAVSRP